MRDRRQAPIWILAGPILQGDPPLILQLHALSGPEDARRTVDYWVAEGVTSWKAYMTITPEELKAAIAAVHGHGQKITGHLCSVGFTEAANLGIDNLEHGIVEDSEFIAGKKAGECPPGSRDEMYQSLDTEQRSRVQAMIHTLVSHHVAVIVNLIGAGKRRGKPSAHEFSDERKELHDAGGMGGRTGDAFEDSGTRGERSEVFAVEQRDGV